MKHILILIFLSMTIYTNAAVTGIEPEIVTTVELSNTDVNRIVCPYPITDYAASKEKSINFQISGSNIFVKFPVSAVTKDGKILEKKFFTGDAELFLVCGDVVYSLVMNAKKKKAETIYLSDTKGKLEKVNEYVRSKSHEELMTEFIQSLIENKPLNDFHIGTSEDKETYRGIGVSISRIMTGGGYIVKELVLESKDKVSLTDTELVKLKMLNNVKAVALLSPTFTGTTKAYVVEAKIR